MNEHKCIQESTMKDFEARLRIVERQSTESTIWFKHISEQIREIKDYVKIDSQKDNQKAEKTKNEELKQIIIVELIKTITLAITILGGIAGIKIATGG